MTGKIVPTVPGFDTQTLYPLEKLYQFTKFNAKIKFSTGHYGGLRVTPERKGRNC